MKYLQVKNLKKSFLKTEALKDVSFSLERGNILAVIGPSGNGKTTLLRCLNFLEIPDCGVIKIDGKTVFNSEMKMKKKDVQQVRDMFGFVFQSFNLFPEYSVFDNVKLALEIAEKRRKKQGLASLIEKNTLDDEVLWVLKKLRLEDKIKSYPCELSGGEKQRVAIARALVLKPSVLCFDEPTSALDPMLTKDIAKLIKEIKNKFQITMLIVTHEMKFAQMVADEVMMLYNGCVEEFGETKSIFENPKSNLLKNFLKESDD